MSELRIRQLLESRLATWADSADVPVAYENASFDPPQTLYLRAFLLPASAGSEFLDGKHTAFIGVFQISICAPLAKGAADANTIASQLRALFPMLLRITGADSFVVTITSPGAIAPAIVDDKNYVVPVSFTYRSDVTS